MTFHRPTCNVDHRLKTGIFCKWFIVSVILPLSIKSKCRRWEDLSSRILAIRILSIRMHALAGLGNNPQHPKHLPKCPVLLLWCPLQSSKTNLPHTEVPLTKGHYKNVHAPLAKRVCTGTMSAVAGLGNNPRHPHQGQISWLCLPPNSALTNTIPGLRARAEFLR